MELFVTLDSYVRTKTALAWLRHALDRYLAKHFIRNCGRLSIWTDILIFDWIYTILF